MKPGSVSGRLEQAVRVGRRRGGLILLVVCAFGLDTRADYRIGQEEIPRVVVHEDVADFAVYPGRPRLFFRDTDLPVIRKRIAGDFKPEWEEMVADLERRALPANPGRFAQNPYLRAWSVGRNVTFVAAVTGDERFIAWARKWGDALAAAEPSPVDGELNGRLKSLAVAYDWLYPWLSEEEKERWRTSMRAHLDHGWRFAEKSVNYISGHSRAGNFALAAGLLALATEAPDLQARLRVVRQNWVGGYFPAQGWIADGGGYHMGWSYSAAFLTGEIHALWSTATNETVFFPWQARLPHFWLYGRQGDGTYPNTGDAYTVTTGLEDQRMLLVTAAGVWKDPHAVPMLRPDVDRFAEILYADKRVESRAPDDPEAPLPLSRHFHHAGVVIVRDRWDEETTHLQFRAVPFYATNHLHRDMNSFTLHYRGGLAIDSGLYDEGGKGPGGYAGWHWKNYFTRTVAHNAIVVYDPAQEMTLWEERISNDGGQPFRDEPERLEDILPGGSSHLPGGVTRYEDARDYVTLTGDATAAYDPARVRLAERELVYLRRTDRAHPIVLVFDRVESVQPNFEKRFLLHTVNEPRLAGRLMVTENRGGRLSCLTLLPERPGFSVIGGPGREAWVEDRNYDWDRTGWKRPRLEPGSWRLEVTSDDARARQDFLHVLFVDAAGAPAVDPSTVHLTQDDSYVRVEVAGWRVTFPRAAGAGGRVEPLDSPRLPH